MAGQEQHFDLIADEYDESLAPHVVDHLLRRRVALARSLQPRGRVLDVGCGTGVFLKAMEAPGYDLCGVDVSDAMVQKALDRGVNATKSGADEMPFETGTFDLVTCIAVLHHLIDPELVRRGVSEMVRVAKPGGAVLIWDHNPLNPYWVVLMRRLPQDQGDERLVAAREIVDPLRASGAMERISLRRMTFTPDFTPRSMMPAVARGERLLERLPGVNRFAAHNVVTAYKV